MTLLLPALSIRQPWAWLVVNGIKPVENRDWPTRFRGRVLIHAGKAMPMPDYMLGRMAWHECGGSQIEMPPPGDMQLGGLVGVAEIVDCVEAHGSPYFTGPYGFVLTNARPLPFVPYQGMLGFFNVPAEAVAAVPGYVPC